MKAFDERTTIGGVITNPASVRGMLCVLPTSALRNGHVAQYPELTPLLARIEELEMKSKVEIMDELVEMLFAASDQ